MKKDTRWHLETYGLILDVLSENQGCCADDGNDRALLARAITDAFAEIGSIEPSIPTAPDAVGLEG